MSASLVGSEMCIRDREYCGTTWHGMAWHDTTRHDMTWHGMTWQDQARPVSYTHLTLPTICSV
eukprot:7106534-Alexandrium_andersonii.AAC.1